MTDVNSIIAPSSAAKVIASLRRINRSATSAPAPTTGECDLCAAPIADTHEHLLDLNSRKLMCSCHPCALLFSSQSTKKFRLVPSRAQLLTDLHLTDLQWNSLGVPINLAFFFRSSLRKQVLAVYPSPGGATESELSIDAWDALLVDHPQIADLPEDVEALLVNRMHGANDCYRVSIDHCYQLVGLVRKHWRGLSGGAEIWKQIGVFFDHLKSSSRGDRRHA